MEIAGMQECINLKFIRLHRNIRVVTKTVKKDAALFYSTQFDPFYNWQLPSMNIKDELIYFTNNACMSPQLMYSELETLVTFATIQEKYKLVANNRHPRDLSIAEWLAIRKLCEEQLMLEKEKQWNGILNDNVRSGSPDNAEDGNIEDDVTELLSAIEDVDWAVIIDAIKYKGFDQRILVTSRSLSADKCEEALSNAMKKLVDFFTRNYGQNEFYIKKGEHFFYIEGYFLYEEGY